MLKLLILSALVSTSTTLLAAHGKTFEIEEKPFGQEMQMPDQEAIKKMQEEHLDRIKAYVDEPPAVQSIGEAKKYRAFYYDPIFRVKEDIKTLDGKVIASEGQLINALDDPTIASACDLIFFDATNEKHIQWAMKHSKAKWILVRGSPLDLEDATDHDVYFDQGGMYCKQFGIECVPAKVAVEGRRILIEEVSCED
jgi:conjugal transfer pilus assembly protein TraW